MYMSTTFCLHIYRTIPCRAALRGWEGRANDNHCAEHAACASVKPHAHTAIVVSTLVSVICISARVVTLDRGHICVRVCIGRNEMFAAATARDGTTSCRFYESWQHLPLL
jgi:hypothetical protein